jgi:hypothetical protein
MKMATPMIPLPAFMIVSASTALRMFPNIKKQKMQLKKYLFVGVSLTALVFLINACKKELGPAAPPPNYSWIEQFDTLSNARDRGWVVINNSRPIGSDSWIQGQYGIDDKGKLVGYSAASYAYSGQDFVVCTYNAGDSVSTLSAWLISKPTVMKNGDQIEFYTRTLSDPSTYPDRMQLRLNPTSKSTNVGSGRLSDFSVANQVGDFTQLLLDINPNLLQTGAGSYPGSWAKYSVTLTGLPAPVERRFAFRYYVTNGGTAGTNSQGVGVDSVAFISN